MSLFLSEDENKERLSFPVHELRRVEIRYKKADIDEVDSTHSTLVYMHERDVETFIKATLELHWKPGINPHASGGKLANVWSIEVTKLDGLQAYWWSTPGLGKGVSNSHETHERHGGARVTSNWSAAIRKMFHYAWVHPAFKKQLDIAYEEMLRAEEEA